MVTAAMAVLALGVGFGFGLLLYWAVRSEASQRRRLSRADAERVARQDADGGPDGRRR